MSLTDRDKQQLAEKEAAAERIWAEKRTFYQPGVPQKPIIREYGVKNLSSGVPVARRLPTLGQEKEAAEAKGQQYSFKKEKFGQHDIFVDSNGARFDKVGRRIIADRRDEELAIGQGARRE